MRPDLLELTPEALTALANAGFVKRAQKDAAAGLLPRIEAGPDGCVTAHFDDGTTTRLPADRTFRDADCTCPASGMCRHRVLLVLACQAQSTSAVAEDAPWSPAQWDDAALAAAFTPQTLALAARLADARPAIGVQPWGGPGVPPVARLPMCSVRFFSRSALAHARCDCSQGSGCEHVVAAVWAFRAAGALAPGSAERMVELPGQGPGAAPATEAACAAQASVEGLLQALWLDGSSQPLMALAARFEAVRAQVQAMGWAWVDDALDELWQLLAAQQARSSRFDAQRLLAVAAELWARLHAAGRAASQAAPQLPASQILGVGVKGSVLLDHLRLVSLGAALWVDDDAAQGMEGAGLLFADPDTQTVTVLERQWPRAQAATPLAARRIAGFALRQLAAGQVVTRAATRRANGQIDLATGTRHTGVMPLSPTAWDDLAAPLKQITVAGLRRALQDALPDFARPRQAASGAATGTAGALHVIAPPAGLAVRDHGWDGAAQTLHVCVTGAEGDEPLYLTLPHRAAAPGAVDTLARALSGEWGALRAVAGAARLDGGRVRMQPLALLTAQRGVALQTEPGAAAAVSLPLQTAGEAPPPLAALAGNTLELLALWLRQGMRHQSAGGLVRGREQAELLRAAGLPRSAALMQAVLAVGRQGLVERLSLLTLMAQGLGD